MHSVSSSYFGAASLTVALLAASFLHFLACLGAWTSRRGLAWRAWSGLPSSFMMSRCSQLNQFSKIWPHMNSFNGCTTVRQYDSFTCLFSLLTSPVILCIIIFTTTEVGVIIINMMVTSKRSGICSPISLFRVSYRSFRKGWPPPPTSACYQCFDSYR